MAQAIFEALEGNGARLGPRRDLPSRGDIWGARPPLLRALPVRRRRRAGRGTVVGPPVRPGPARRVALPVAPAVPAPRTQLQSLQAAPRRSPGLATLSAAPCGTTVTSGPPALCHLLPARRGIPVCRVALTDRRPCARCTASLPCPVPDAPEHPMPSLFCACCSGAPHPYPAPVPADPGHSVPSCPWCSRPSHPLPAPVPCTSGHPITYLCAQGTAPPIPRAPSTLLCLAGPCMLGSPILSMPQGSHCRSHCCAMLCQPQG